MNSPGGGGGDQHRFRPHQLFISKRLRQVDIPPRKLLSRRAAAVDMPVYSPRFDELALLQKFLPYNNPQGDDDETDIYAADHFRMYEFKVRRCTHSRSHDWTDCPFMHPGEKARRRDPRKYHYSGIGCQNFRRDGECPRGDNCEFAHGVFECWLHPARYRTQACKDGRSCERKICFFAHTTKQLRVMPHELMNPRTEWRPRCSHSHDQCSVLSPNSTLMMSMPDVSPPLSPSVQMSGMGGFRPMTRPMTRGQKALAELAELKRRHGPGYKKELLKIMNSIQAMNMNEKKSASASGKKDGLWVDVPDPNPDDQQPYFMSPNSTQSSSGSNESPSDPGSSGSGQSATSKSINFDFPEETGGPPGAPDLGWVNDLCDCD